MCVECGLACWDVGVISCPGSLWGSSVMPWLEGRGRGAPWALELSAAPRACPCSAKVTAASCSSGKEDGSVELLLSFSGWTWVTCWFFWPSPPSLEAELSHCRVWVSDSWDQFGTHSWEENVLWNNFFFSVLLNSKDKKSKEKKCQRVAQCSGCHPLGADSRGRECVTRGSSHRAAEPSLPTFLFLMDESTSSFQEVHHARVYFSWGSLKAFFSLSLFPVPCSYQRCAWGPGLFW